MKCSSWILLLTVTWEVLFTPYGGGASFTSQRTKTFHTEQEKAFFIETVPLAPFECVVESTTSQHGVCEVKNLK